jgi:hypothetical protein
MDILFEIWTVPLFLVGGYVRDLILGIEATDRDICSSLLPEEVVALCLLHGIKASVTNESHLVVTLWVNGESIEHTTFRSEKEYDGRHARVVEASTQEEDAFRRDLTINALYLSNKGKIIDLVGGLGDINGKVLRLISSPQYGDEYQRLWEHGGRLFRLARFASSKFKGWTIEAKTFEACKAFAPIVFTRGKWESFGEEWEKSGYCWEYLQVLDTFGFLSSHDLVLPDKQSFSINYPWYSLWVASGRPNLNDFQKRWKLMKDEVLTIKDLELGLAIREEYQWLTTSFRRLKAEEVASFWGQSFRTLVIPTQGDIAREGIGGPKVKEEWIERVKDIYN